jgi:N-acetylglucosamine kinase-like BadF-type ATPase
VIRTVIGTASLFTYASEDETRMVCQGVIDPTTSCLLGDALTALYGATGGRPGVLIISGTGSIAVSLGADKQFHTAGGFGPWIGGDPGSAFWMASQAVLAASQNRSDTALAEVICDYFQIAELHEIVPIVYGAKDGCRRLAGLARFLADDPAAQTTAFVQIQRQAGHALAAMTAPLLAGDLASAEVVFVSGSVLQQNAIVRTALEEGLQQGCGRSVRLATPALPAAAGAALLALDQSGTRVTDSILLTLHGSSR